MRTAFNMLQTSTYYTILLLILSVIFCSCEPNEQKNGSNKLENSIDISNIQDSLLSLYPDEIFRIERGVKKVAELWTPEDGSEEQMTALIYNNFVAGNELERMFSDLNDVLETVNGNFNKMSVKLKMPVHTNSGEISNLAGRMADWEPSAHFTEDMFQNKTAFIIALNFPFYSLKEKEELATEWDDKDWAYAFAGDLFSSRVGPEAGLKVSEAQNLSDKYISEYYIYMGNIVDSSMNSYFPEDMRLISHWNLRDEIKSNYANKDNGLIKQELVYNIMLDIITQEIPIEVINKNDYYWDPIADKLYNDANELKQFTPEDTVRYHYLLENFLAVRNADTFYPVDQNYIVRKFEGEMGYSFDKIENLFTELVSSDVVKETASLVEKRLGRPLQPWDIWYDGFKARSSINEDLLTAKTKKRYPDAQAFKDDLPRILRALGFNNSRANWLAEQVEVDASRGAGHAWGAQMKSDHARLRTHIKNDGMDYKGYNIAVHEFGHNIEQTISLHDSPYYLMNGVPNTAFSEATAFVFQSRDLMLLGEKTEDKHAEYFATLDNLWTNYEMMGVSLVDMRLWKWLYENPDVTPQQLKEKTIEIASEVWDEYYMPIFGSPGSPILAVYSHMIDYPLYLASYPVGYLAQFQLEEYMADKNLAKEMQRVLSIGKLPPDIWMKKAVGEPLSTAPLFRAAEQSLKVINNPRYQPIPPEVDVIDQDAHDRDVPDSQSSNSN